jgi:diguanylate cyclase (GGDEF)-like protein/PAS domain S-box-containing protein
MPLHIKIKDFFTKSLVSLISVTLLILFVLVAILFFGHGYYLNEMEKVIAAGELESKKMQINSELMEIARARTRLTAQIIDTADAFIQDELNVQLELLAGRFAYLRQQLLGLELYDDERQIVEQEHAAIVSIILPAQRKVVELAMSDNPGDLEEAKSLLYETVLPGQGKMIDSFGELIALEQSRISKLSSSSRDTVQSIKKKSNYLTGIVLSGVFILSIIVVFRVRQIQLDLLNSKKHLERTVSERTDKLNKAKNELQRYVDLVDKHIITSHTDRKGKISYVSDAFCTISRFSQEELIDQDFGIMRHPDMPGEVYEDLWHTIQSGKSWRGEIKNLTKDGGEYWLDLNIDPQIDQNGDITGYAAISHDISDKRRIQELSVTDPLTQLANRLKLDEVISYETDRAHRYHYPLSVVLFDIDYFKEINDNFGHQVGDTVLASFGNIVQSVKREADIAGRWGGEEFLIICPNTDKHGAAKLAEKLRKVIAEYQFTTIGTKTCSFGVATLQTEQNAHELIRHADNALYQAKNEGRNRVVVST